MEIHGGAAAKDLDVDVIIVIVLLTDNFHSPMAPANRRAISPPVFLG